MIPRDSDLYYAVTLIKELTDELKTLRAERAYGKPAKTVRSGSSGGSKKRGVRKGKTVRSAGSSAEIKPMEGGE